MTIELRFLLSERNCLRTDDIKSAKSLGELVVIKRKGASWWLGIVVSLAFAIFTADYVIGGGYLFLRLSTHTASVDVRNGLKLNFSVRRRWEGMDQTISLSRYTYVFDKMKEEVYRKPYWAGGPLYADKNSLHYYMVIRGECTEECYFFFIVDTAKRNISSSCDIDKNVAKDLKYIGQFSYDDGILGLIGYVRFTQAGQPPENLRLNDDSRKLKRWCDD